MTTGFVHQAITKLGQAITHELMENGGTDNGGDHRQGKPLTPTTDDNVERTHKLLTNKQLLDD